MHHQGLPCTRRVGDKEGSVPRLPPHGMGMPGERAPVCLSTSTSIPRPSQRVRIGSLLERGRVDAFFEKNPRSHEMNKSQQGLAQFLIPRGNVAKLSDMVKEPFHLRASLGDIFII
jgi:hypothetical protein